MRKEKIYLMKAGVEIGLATLSFSYNAIKYRNIIDIAKWFIYLTNLKMEFLALDGAMEIKNFCYNRPTTSPFPSIENNPSPTVELNRSGFVSLPSEEEEGGGNLAHSLLLDTSEEKDTFRRMLTLQIVLTADLLYAALDRSIDRSYLSIPFHSLDAIVLIAVYIYCKTPVLTHNKRKDFFAPMAVLYGFSLFYLIYQGAFHGTNQEGEPPYQVLNYHGDQAEVIETCIYSFLLPIVMPLINRAIFETIEAVQLRRDTGPENQQKADRRRDNYCLRLNNKLSSCCSGLFSYIRRHLPTFSSSGPQLDGP